MGTKCLGKKPRRRRRNGKDAERTTNERVSRGGRYISSGNTQVNVLEKTDHYIGNRHNVRSTIGINKHDIS